MRLAISLLRRAVSTEHVSARTSRRCREFTPRLECLEDRLVMSTLVVDPSVKGDYATIGAAVAAASAGSTIDVDYDSGHVYQEQVVVSKNLTIQTTPSQKNATIEAPATALTGTPVMVDFTGTAVTKAALENLNIMGPGTGLEAGVDVEKGATGVTISGNTISNIHEQSSIRSGIQIGIGVLIGGDTGGTYTAGSATVSGNSITGYQKGGIVVENSGSSATVSGNSVTGAGSTNALAENGIEVGYGATATVTGNSVSNNIYGLSSPTGYEAADILLYQPGSGTTVTGNSCTNSDVAIWVVDAANGSISSNSISSFNYAGIALDIVSTGCSGEKVNSNSISGGSGANAGIILFSATSCTVSSNSISSCGDGIWLAGSDTSNTISSNSVSKSVVDGIVVADYNSADPNSIGTTSTSSGNTFSSNTATGSGTWDALDVSKGSGTAGTADTWKGDSFTKKSPSGLA